MDYTDINIPTTMIYEYVWNHQYGRPVGLDDFDIITVNLGRPNRNLYFIRYEYNHSHSVDPRLGSWTRVFAGWGRPNEEEPPYGLWCLAGVDPARTYSVLSRKIHYRQQPVVFDTWPIIKITSEPLLEVIFGPKVTIRITLALDHIIPGRDKLVLPLPGYRGHGISIIETNQGLVNDILRRYSSYERLHTEITEDDVVAAAQILASLRAKKNHGCD